MANLLVENYLAQNYSKWLRRTKRLCYLYSIRESEAQDILQETMLIVFQKKDEAAIQDMISIVVHDRHSMLDIFISRTVRNRLSNVNKHIKVVRKTIAQEVYIDRLKVTQTEYAPHYDVYEKQRQVSAAICKLNTSDVVKRALNWRLVDNNALHTARGTQQSLTQRYRFGLQILQQAINAQPNI